MVHWKFLLNANVITKMLLTTYVIICLAIKQSMAKEWIVVASYIWKNLIYYSAKVCFIVLFHNASVKITPCCGWPNVREGVSVFIYIYIYISVCVYVYVCGCVCVSVRVCVCVCPVPHSFSRKQSTQARIIKNGGTVFARSLNKNDVSNNCGGRVFKTSRRRRKRKFKFRFFLVSYQKFILFEPHRKSSTSCQKTFFLKWRLTK